MTVLYHYTSLQGGIGILHSRSVWATHASYLTDANEFFHGLEFAKRYASGIYMEDDYLSAFGWAVRHGLEGVSTGHLYVASFSEKADLLSQWRGYCPAGAGLCLGFEGASLRSFCAARGYKLERCIYSHDEQGRQVEALVGQCFERFPKPRLSRGDYAKLNSKGQVNAEIDYRIQTSEGTDRPQADEVVAWLCTEISELAPRFKHEGFNEESEWRIVANKPSEPVKFRASASYLIPYIELGILSESTDALREVIIGPNPNQRRCEASVKMLLESRGLTEVAVKASPLPFNVW